MMPFEELTESQRAYRLEEALKLSEEARKNLYGIGMQKERTVHSVLKFYLEPDSEQHEIPIGSFIADIYHRDPPEVLEIQTANFGNLRKKLDAFLQEMPVTVIYPIPWHKWVYWSDPETGEVSSYLCHPRLSFWPVLLDVKEYRILDGWSQDKKRGAHRIDRIPTQIGPSALIRTPQDLVRLLPPLPHPFTAKDFLHATHFSPRASSYALSALRSAGSVTQCGTEGRSFLYQTL